MKSFKKILSLSLVVVFAFSICGCKDTDNKNITASVDYKQGVKCAKNEVLSYSDDILTLSLDGKTCNITVTENSS